MNKRLKFYISVILILAMILSVFCIPAASYEHDVKTSTEDMLLINLDTNTVVFSQKPDNMWHLGTLSELMTFLIADEEIEKPEEVVVTVRKSFLDKLPYSDGCLNSFVDKKLSAKDLMAIMLLTSGSDAAYALADIVSDRDRDAFVKKMNDRAAELKMTDTVYVSPGYSDSTRHHTTCSDLYTIYMKVRENKFFRQLMTDTTYIPDGYEEKDQVSVAYSILDKNSPYYFRYTADAQYSYSKETYAGLVMTTVYHGMTYFFAGLLGLNESEQNINYDAKKLTSWAYSNLSDRRVSNDDFKDSSILVKTDWGEYPVALSPLNSSLKTMPNVFEEEKISYEYTLPTEIKTPYFAGQSIGKAKMSYDGQTVDTFDLTVDSDEGVGMLHDFKRYIGYVYSELTPNTPRETTGIAQNKKDVPAQSSSEKPDETESSSKDATAAASAPAESAR